MAVEQWGPPTNLADRHRMILESSAITPERMALWRSVERPEELPAGLATWGKKAVPCMATEWRTISGNGSRRFVWTTQFQTKMVGRGGICSKKTQAESSG